MPRRKKLSLQKLFRNKALLGRRSTLLVLCVVFCISCQSPLLNHKKADEVQSGVRARAGCQSATCHVLEWLDSPSLSNASSFKLQLMTDLVLEGANLKVELWMPDHGHGSAPVTVTRVNSHEFIASEIYFIMPGLWEVRMVLTDNIGQIVWELTEDIRL